MTIRNKSMLGIVITFSSIIIILWAISRFVLLENLSKLEVNDVRQNVGRVLNSLSCSQSSLESAATDWSSWDDTYSFIDDGNIKYINSNLTDSTFINLKLNVILFISSSHKIVFGKAFDLNGREELPVPRSLQAHLSGDSSFLNNPDTVKAISGILLLADESPLLITSLPILASNGEGPARGTLIFGRYLDATEIEQLSKSLSLSLTFYRSDVTELPSEVSKVYPSLVEKETIVIQPPDTHCIAGYALLKDIYGRPSLVVKVEMPRAIYREYQSAFTCLIVAITVVSVIAGLLSILFSEKLGLSRLDKLTQSVKSISTSGDISERVSMSGKDEVSSLANNINIMLESLQRSENELKVNTERLRVANMEAQSANQAKSEFLSNVSHELRTPLTAIIGLTQLLQKKYFGPLNEKQSEYVQDILGSSNHLLSLINEILDMAKIEAGKSKLELAEIPVKELIGSSLLLIKEVAMEKRIDVRAEIPEEVLNMRIIVDKLRFRQIMVNLLSNAIKFTETNGRVIIELKQKEDELVVSVSDNGIGISREEQSKVFDAFYQVNVKTTGKTPGTGLGLSLAKHLVELHQGRIWVESEGINKGSRFSFSISLRLQNQELEAAYKS
jgi:signal transduction histidine kinase